MLMKHRQEAPPRRRCCRRFSPARARYFALMPPLMRRRAPPSYFRHFDDAAAISHAAKERRQSLPPPPPPPFRCAPPLSRLMMPSSPLSYRRLQVLFRHHFAAFTPEDLPCAFSSVLQRLHLLLGGFDMLFRLPACSSASVFRCFRKIVLLLKILPTVFAAATFFFFSQRYARTLRSARLSARVTT